MATGVSGLAIRFPEDFDERAEWEAAHKGWLQGVTVELTDGATYALFFYDPVRLQQDLEAEVSQGRPCLAEPGLVVVPEVTGEAIRRAVECLARDGFFAHLRPLRQTHQDVA